MSMRISKIATYMRPEEAHMLVEILDQLRDALMQTYGNDIMAMMQEATTTTTQERPYTEVDGEPF